jgi:8-oxo-dGTP pyrophosphatase MutT (NUDIX family)
LVVRVEQAGAIPFTVVKGRPKILLVRARQTPSDWIFPKGHIEPGEDAAAAAVRELEEEAGVRGTMVQYVGALAFRSGSEDVNVRYYLIRYDGAPRGGEGRRQQTFDIDSALDALAHQDARELLATVRREIERQARET